MIAALAITALATVTCTVIGTGMLRQRAQGWGLVDVPNERSMHKTTMPRGGGVVIVLTVMAGLAVWALGDLAPAARVAAYIAVAFAVAAIGWRDDLRSVAPPLRLLIHGAAAIAAVAIWGAFDRVQVPFDGALILPPPVAAAITVLWLVGLLNAYNFMDGIDGIASGQAVVAGVMWVLLGGTAAPLTTATAALLAAASLGFLWHNWSPARIFMGDVGSGFLGFSFALLPLMAFEAAGDARLPVAGVLVVAPFVFDTVYTFIRRAWRRENVFDAHRSHLYQRMVTSGWSHAAISSLYVGLAGLSGGAAVAWLGGASDAWLLLPAAGVFSLPALTVLAERTVRS